MKNLILILSTLTFCAAKIHAQASSTVYRSVEQEASYPGGLKALTTLMQNELVYPQACMKRKIQGRAEIEFMVTAEGSCAEYRIATSSGNAKLDAEAMRVAKVAGLLRWTPAMSQGTAVGTYFTLPISFSLN
jgi:TonB family protein